MDTAAILAELARIEQLNAPPSAYYVNADDYAALLAVCPKAETPSLDYVPLVPSKRVPPGLIVPGKRFGWSNQLPTYVYQNHNW